MLTRIEIDGFKTFEKFSLDLEPFMVVVGPNATGKSNLFDAIQLLSRLAVDDLRTAFNGLRGEPHELFRIQPSGEPGSRMSLAVEVLLHRTVADPWGGTARVRHTRLRYEVDLERRTDARGIERLVVARETAEPIRGNADGWRPHGRSPSAAFKRAFMSYGRSTPFLSTQDVNGIPTFHIHQDPTGGRNRSATAAETTILSSITSAEFPHLFALREELRSWKFLQLDPGALRKPSPKNAPEVLEPDGSNLPTVLARIEAETRTEPRPHGALTEIGADLSRLISGVARVDVEEDELNRKFRVKVQVGGEHAFSSGVISDGTLRVLALLTMLHDPKHSGLVCFEEPENGIHPARLEALIDILRGMVTRADLTHYDERAALTQMLLNSHSPVVLSHLDGTEVVFADTVTVVDPASRTRSRKTRMRRIVPDDQGDLGIGQRDRGGYATRFDVAQYLKTVVQQAG
ncbi:MAG TPA: AAA family ATPase [Longimicrobium sp.]|jgi:predicted ATPase